jgi:metallo-beta-lactamase class B
MPVRKLLRLKVPLVAAVLLLGATAATRQSDDATRRAWNRPVEPFRVAGNIYYVGVAGVASFLITTPDGHILLDGGFEESVPRIEEGVRKLGFKLADVKFIINSHAHFDHAGGLAGLKRSTGAKLLISEADAPLVAAGGSGDFYWGDKPTFEPAAVDRVLRDKDEVTLGGVTLIARLTPGHTKGCTTWTTKVREGGKELDVVFVGSTTVPGYRLVNNALYPEIAADYARTFALLKTLKCDVFLGPHGSFFDLDEKRQRLARGAKENPFIDPRGYQRFVERTENEYLRQLRGERARGR